MLTKIYRKTILRKGLGEHFDIKIIAKPSSPLAPNNTSSPPQYCCFEELV
jgi:hypothetical protein